MYAAARPPSRRHLRTWPGSTIQPSQIVRSIADGGWLRQSICALGSGPGSTIQPSQLARSIADGPWLRKNACTLDWGPRQYYPAPSVVAFDRWRAVAKTQRTWGLRFFMGMAVSLYNALSKRYRYLPSRDTPTCLPAASLSAATV